MSWVNQLKSKEWSGRVEPAGVDCSQKGTISPHKEASGVTLRKHSHHSTPGTDWTYCREVERLNRGEERALQFTINKSENHFSRLSYFCSLPTLSDEPDTFYSPPGWCPDDNNIIKYTEGVILFTNTCVWSLHYCIDCAAGRMYMLTISLWTSDWLRYIRSGHPYCGPQ